PQGQPELPAPAAAAAAAMTLDLNLTNIQGDILIGMKKNKEKFFFFSINDRKIFKQRLKSGAKFITTTTQLVDVNKQPAAMVNVAFSQTGLQAMG
ncbi:hypothetical protein M422DRAFT_137411, partial [Sphaerobolus stellatus SS14]